MYLKDMKIGMVFKSYVDICRYLEQPMKSGVPKVNQIEEWHRYFNWEKKPHCDKWYITEVYDTPKPTPVNGFYKMIFIPVQCSKTDYEYLMQCNKYSADVWNYLVALDKQTEKLTGKYMTRQELQSSVKNISPLPSSSNQYVFSKYYAARDAGFKSIAAKHEESNKVKLPYKEKKFFPTGWTKNNLVIDYDNGIIKLGKAKEGKFKQQQVFCYAKTIPEHIVEVELHYRKGLKLAIKYKAPNTIEVIKSNNVASIDLGEIHTITSIDNNGNAIIITGRKMRSIKRLRDKEQAKLRSKRDKCIKGSRQYKKYNRAIYNLTYKTDKQILDCVHKITSLYVDYCLENGIKTVYYGDLDNCTRDTKERMRAKSGQKINEWNHGEVTRQLENKLGRYGIKIIEVKEYYTSQTCPCCGKRYKPTNRNYECAKCGYIQHRDIVGAINILNDNTGTKVTRYINKKYLQIA